MTYDASAIARIFRDTSTQKQRSLSGTDAASGMHQQQQQQRSQGNLFNQPASDELLQRQLPNVEGTVPQMTERHVGKTSDDISIGSSCNGQMQALTSAPMPRAQLPEVAEAIKSGRGAGKKAQWSRT